MTIARSLQKRTILVTRSQKQSGAFSDLLRQAGATVLEIPTIEIVPTDPAPLDRALAQIGRYHWLFFTSANAVDLFFRRYKALGKGKLLPRICSIGPATSDRIRAHQVEVFLQPAVFQAEGILEEFAGLYDGDLSGLRILLPRARLARDILPKELERCGARVDLIPVYDTRIPDRSRRLLEETLAGVRPDLVTFTSSSTVRHFVELISETHSPDAFACAVIGPITRDTAREAGFKVVCMPEKATIPDLAEAVKLYFQDTGPIPTSPQSRAE